MSEVIEFPVKINNLYYIYQILCVIINDSAFKANFNFYVRDVRTDNIRF